MAEKTKGRAMRKRLTQSRWSKLIPLAGVLALLTTSASTQTPMPSISLQGDPEHPLTMEEQEQRKKFDDDYEAATKKIPNQKADANRSRSKKEAAIN
jgi:hypothetical protein